MLMDLAVELLNKLVLPSGVHVERGALAAYAADVLLIGVEL